MTREEAIEIINRENDPNDKKVWEVFPEYREALDMAIKALSQEPCTDAVRREAVLEAVSEGCQEWRGIYGRCEELINELPPVTPSRHVNCEIAEHDGNGCLGYSHYGDDFPIKECLHCPKYTSYEE